MRYVRLFVSLHIHMYTYEIKPQRRDSEGPDVQDANFEVKRGPTSCCTGSADILLAIPLL